MSTLDSKPPAVNARKCKRFAIAPQRQTLPHKQRVRHQPKGVPAGLPIPIGLPNLIPS
jgi:hypothetical protein